MVVIPHDDYHKNHRMPRVLIVANDFRDFGNGRVFPSPELIAIGLDCNCSKFVAIGSDNVHAVIPEKHDKGPLDTVKDVFQQAVKEERPYDLIIVDSEACRKEIHGWANNLNPKPGVVMYVPGMEDAEGKAEKLRQKGIPAFSRREMLWSTDPNVPPAKFDEQVTQALGESGIKRLECESKDSIAVQWPLVLRKKGERFREVQPSDSIRSPIKSTGSELPGHA